MTALAPRFAPDFRLRINGTDVPTAVRSCVTSVRYEDGRGAADRVEVGLANPDLRWLQQHIRGLGVPPFPAVIPRGPSGFPGPPSGLFDVDNRLDLAIGYAPGPLDTMFDGEITGAQASFPSSGMASLTLVAHDRLQRLTRGTAARGFGPLPDAVIAAVLAAENLLLPVIDPAVIGASTALRVADYYFGGAGRKQRDQSDFDFLKEICARYDAEFWVEGDILYVARFVPRSYAPALTLGWGSSLIDFSPQASTVGRVVSVAMKFTLRELKVTFVVTVFWDFDREQLGVQVTPGAAAAGQKSVVGPGVTLIDQPISSPADLANSALAIIRELRTKLNNRLTATGTAVGDPRIRAGAVIQMEGLGPSFSGNYRVASATHTLDAGGYRTTFQVRREIIP